MNEDLGYIAYFNLVARPFDDICGPRFIWLGSKQLENLAYLKVGVEGRKGILLLIGEEGSGKSVLVDRLLPIIAGDLKTVINEKNIEEQVVVAYGDNVTDLDVGKLVKFHEKSGLPATMALFKVPKNEVDRFGIATLKNGRITNFVEKPTLKKAKSNLANAGYYVLEPSVFERIPLKKVKMENSLFPELAAKNLIAGFVCKVKLWLDIGTLHAYRTANKLVEEILPPE